jgi:hypothetical protein
MKSHQPPFWLTVKEEYIIDNFEAMLRYLSNYNYDSHELNTDYNNTYNTLQSAVNGFLEATRCLIMPRDAGRSPRRTSEL